MGFEMKVEPLSPANKAVEGKGNKIGKKEKEYELLHMPEYLNDLQTVVIDEADKLVQEDPDSRYSLEKFMEILPKNDDGKPKAQLMLFESFLSESVTGWMRKYFKPNKWFIASNALED